MRSDVIKMEIWHIEDRNLEVVEWIHLSLVHLWTDQKDFPDSQRFHPSDEIYQVKC